MNKTKIKLTYINYEQLGWNDLYLDHYFNDTLLLRKIRKVGDEEIVNNFVLGQLNKHKKAGSIDFIKENE